MIDTPRTSRLLRLSSILLVALLAGGSATLIVGSAVEAAENAAFHTITSENLVQMLQQKDFVLVNVHIPYEGEIAETDTFIPFDRIAENLNKLPADEAANIVLYCRSGRMSEIAATTLAGLGYTHVDHLAGGMIGWETSGHRLLHE